MLKTCDLKGSVFAYSKALFFFLFESFMVLFSSS